MLCDQVIIDRDNGKPTAVGIFTGLASKVFPTLPRQIDAFAVLTDGIGRQTLEVAVTSLSDNEEISIQRIEQEFPDPLRLVNVRFRFRALTFPTSGLYLFELLADGEPICHCRLRVRLLEKSS
jgi:hypothetical protein